MDFLAVCQGLGLALAAGLVIGVVLPPIMPTWGVIAGAAPLGVLACIVALNSEDEDVWPAIPIGILAAGLAAIVSREVASGAARRQAGGPRWARRRRRGSWPWWCWPPRCWRC